MCRGRGSSKRSELVFNINELLFYLVSFAALSALLSGFPRNVHLKPKFNTQWGKQRSTTNNIGGVYIENCHLKLNAEHMCWEGEDLLSVQRAELVFNINGF